MDDKIIAGSRIALSGKYRQPGLTPLAARVVVRIRVNGEA